MQTTAMRGAVLALFGLIFFGCSDTQPAGSTGQGNTPSGSSAAQINVREGVAICVFGKSGKEFKLGNVESDQVKLFATYGGVTLTLKDLEETVAGIAGEDADASGNEQRALANALFSQQLPGIWIVEAVSVDGKTQAVRDDDPDYLVIGADKTFRIVKKGKKPEGTWELNSEGQLLMNATNDESRIAKMKRQPGDKLDLTIDDSGSVVNLRYGRTDLTDAPKAVDEE